MAGGRDVVRDDGRATGQWVGPLRQRRHRPSGHLGLIWYLGQQDRRTNPVALQYQIWKTHSTGKYKEQGVDDWIIHVWMKG